MLVVIYVNDIAAAYPLVILNVVVWSTVQVVPLLMLAAMVVAATAPTPVLRTQLGNVDHAVPTHVIFSWPLARTYPVLHCIGTYEPDSTAALFVGSFCKLYAPAMLIVLVIVAFCMKANNDCVGHEPISNSYLLFEGLQEDYIIITVT